MAREVKFAAGTVWVEIPLSALAYNLCVIRRHIGHKRKLLAAVKANAYGYGAVAVSKALANAGANWFGVTCTTEGAELHEVKIRHPILLLRSATSSLFGLEFRNTGEISPVVSSAKRREASPR